jgi:hypothetical protein
MPPPLSTLQLTLSSASSAIPTSTLESLTHLISLTIRFPRWSFYISSLFSMRWLFQRTISYLLFAIGGSTWKKWQCNTPLIVFPWMMNHLLTVLMRLHSFGEFCWYRFVISRYCWLWFSSWCLWILFCILSLRFQV